MSRIISDETFAEIINYLAKDRAVALFQKLLLSENTASKEPITEGEEDGQ